MKNNEQKIVKTYNGCEVTITFAGRDDKAMEEAKKLILESYYDRVKIIPTLSKEEHPKVS